MRIITGNDLSGLRTPVNRSDGSKCSGVEEILERWREHYDQTLNHPSGTVCPELDAASSVVTPDIDICTDEPTLDEVVRAVKKLKNDRAAGCDDIPPELFKCALPHVSQALHSLFQRVWRSGCVPAEWKDGIIVSLVLRDQRMNAVVTDLSLSFPCREKSFHTSCWSIYSLFYK